MHRLRIVLVPLYFALLLASFYITFLSNTLRDPWIEHLPSDRLNQLLLIFSAFLVAIIIFPKISVQGRLQRFALGLVRILLIVLAHYFIFISISKGAFMTCYLLQCGPNWGEIERPW
jgi:hypothetical protein